ncbi:MAG: hypothetical protein KIT84_08290 [Labilithrix sp.]|nr:hypothetical protein [Labilithrix sp.]MCW5810996.1 hypothetical protein [Labilithrix sp.]
MRRGLLRVAGVVIVFRAAFVACVGADPNINDTQPRGDEGAACFEDGTCRSGLSCASGRCVRFSGGQDSAPPVDDDSGPTPPPPDADADADAETDAGADADAGPPPECATGTPCELPDLLAWYRADRGVVAVNHEVQEWRDQSKNGHHATRGDAEAPTLWDASARFDGGPYIQFAGGAGNKDTPQRLLTQIVSEAPIRPMTVYLALSFDSAARSSGYVFDGHEPAVSRIGFTNGAGDGIYPFLGGASVLDPDVPLTEGQPVLFEAVFAGPGSGMAINNVEVATGDVGAYGARGFSIGAAAPGDNLTRNFEGSIAEVLVFGAGHSAEDRLKVIDWLRTRHGLY